MELSYYLNFKGQCEEAFRFYEKTLGGKIQAMMTFEGSPMADKIPAEWGKKVMHARMTVGDQALMGGDPPPANYSAPQGFAICIGVKSAPDADRIFRALSENGKVTMPMQETFWAVRYGMLIDQYGIPWMVNCEKTA